MGLNLADEMAVDSFTVGIVPSLPDCEYHGHFGWSAGSVAVVRRAGAVFSFREF